MTAQPTLAEDFDAGAPRYDLLTSLNPGYHAALRTAARRVLDLAPAADSLVLDLGCGSGLSTRALLREARGPVRVVGIDASAGMLERARRKRWPAGVTFREGRAQDLPELLVEEHVPEAHGILGAYLLRNIPEAERDAALRAMHDALAPGSALVLQDYSVAGRRGAQTVWSLVCLGVVLPLAVLLRGNPRLYVYLWRSVLAMDPVPRIERRLHEAGFVDIRTITGSGWQRGILHTTSARRAEVVS